MKKLFVTSLVVLMLFVSSIGVFAADPDKDIVETAIEAENFNTLVDAVIAADLVEALKAEGPFTVFAPTDEAFENLPEGMLEGLLEDTAAIGNVLLYHVVDGKVMAADVLGLDGENVQTLLEQNDRKNIDKALFEEEVSAMMQLNLGGEKLYVYFTTRIYTSSFLQQPEKQAHTLFYQSAAVFQK